MPYVEIATTDTIKNHPNIEKFANDLTAVLLEVEGLQDNAYARSIALIDIRSFGNLYIGGSRHSGNKMMVRIYGFKEVFTEEAKALLHKHISELAIAQFSVDIIEIRDVWSMCLPLNAYEFGVSGVPVSLEDTKAFVNQ